jgi:hypothetical protein
MTEPLPDIYVFASSDGELLGLSVKTDGSNLPSNVSWDHRDVVPMTATSLARYVPHAEIALANLIMRGYHLARLTAQIVPFPQPNRNSS